MSSVSRISVPTSGGPIPGDLATPDGVDPWPGRVFAFFHEQLVDQD
jgi:hypothetical protein